MAYRLVTFLQLGITGATDLRAQLLNPDGTNSGAAISTGFADLGGGQYLWDYSSYPDGFYGAVAFYRASAPGTRWIHAINPQEGENLDAKITSRMATFAYTAPDNTGIASILSADDQAIVQLVKSNPSAGGDGLIRLNRAVATANQGALTIDHPGGAVTIALTDDASVQLNHGDYFYDIKMLLSDGSSVVLAQGNCLVRLTSTHTV